MLSQHQRDFLLRQRVGHLATADRHAAPHVVPVCFALADDTLYITVDAKPKRPGAVLKRVRNILENPAAAFVADHYEEEWGRLGWVMLGGQAEVLANGEEHARAQALLRARYTQLAAMQISSLPVIALRIERATSWGDLSVATVMPGLVPGIQPSARTGASGGMDPGDKHRDDT